MWCFHDLGHGRSRHVDILRMLLETLSCQRASLRPRPRLPGPPPTPNILQLMLLVTSGRLQILRPISFTAATDGRQSTSSKQASHEAPAFAFPPSSSTGSKRNLLLQPTFRHTTAVLHCVCEHGVHAHPYQLEPQRKRARMQFSAVSLDNHSILMKGRFRRPGQTRLPSLKKLRNWCCAEDG